MHCLTVQNTKGAVCERLQLQQTLSCAIAGMAINRDDLEPRIILSQQRLHATHSILGLVASADDD
jgi:hypothetical protein